MAGREPKPRGARRQRDHVVATKVDQHRRQARAAAPPDADAPGDDAIANQDAAIYARVSSLKQATLPQQIRLCRKFCENSGLRLRYIFQEKQSAKDLSRPQLQKLLQACKEGRVKVIVTWKLDRMARSLRDLLNTHKMLESWGVSLVSLTENINTTTAFGRYSFRGIASAGELERELIGERVQMGKQAQVVAGRWPSNAPPYGYKIQADGHLEVSETEARWVRQIFAWYASGVPVTEISYRLAMKKVLTLRKRTFSTGAIDHIVKNGIYRGHWDFMGVKEQHPQLRIIAEKTWRACKDRVGQKRFDGDAEKRRLAAVDSVFDTYLRNLRNEDGVRPQGARSVTTLTAGLGLQRASQWRLQSAGLEERS